MPISKKMEVMRGYANARGIPTYSDEEIKGCQRLRHRRQDRNGCSDCLPAGSGAGAEERQVIAMDINDLRSIVTVVRLLCFPGDRGVGIQPWQQEGFEEAAQPPFSGMMITVRRPRRRTALKKRKANERFR